MMENDDKLIKNFLLAGKQEVADNGFSRRVMQQLPSSRRAERLSNLLNVVCTIVCLVCFYVFDGVEVLWQTVKELLALQTYQLITQANLQTLLIAFIVLAGLGVQRAWSLR